MLKYSYILLMFCFHHAVLSVESILIKTTTGSVRGKLNRYGKINYCSYEGIPYAEPPLGDLRFRPPVPVKPWKHLNAYAPGPACPQNENAHVRSEMSEDCLYLNIYVPLTAGDKLLPVIFFIHGGYYIVNSGRPKPIYGPQLILEKGMIIVTINYRLGALGFLSFDHVHASGNAGLKDVILASKWVKDNIINFGGNPKQICLVGTGVGGALAHLILLTDQSSGIFQSAIIVSGSALSYRTIQDNPKENALKLVRQLGIKCYDKHCIKKLKKVDAFDIVEAELNILRNDPRRAFTLVNLFSPTVERPSSIAILTRHPLDIIKSDGLLQKIPVITGFNNQEGLEIFSVIRNNPATIDGLNENFELCIPPNIQYPPGSQESKDLAESIREQYFSGGNISIFNTQNYVNLITDTAYAFGIDYWIKLYKKQEKCSAVYYYIFQFDGQLNWGKLNNGITYPGACRADDLGYIFLTNLTKNILPNLNEETERMLENVLSQLKNVAIHGYPALREYGCFQWFETGLNRSHIVVDNKISIVHEPPLQDRLGFWYKEYAKYYEYERNNGGCA